MDIPICGHTLDDNVCQERGDHFCIPRADHAQAFIENVCVHTKDKYARKPFILTEWQREEIVRPLFGQVSWRPDTNEHARQFKIAWIELGRKQGKSELLAAFALYLLLADGMESAEIYGCARDTKQAGKVYEVAERMVQLSPVLNPMLKRGVIKINRQQKRLIYTKTNSYYEIITADAAGELGHNPHGVIMDEVLTQRDGSLWDAMRTAMGTRTRPMMIAATTAGDSNSDFCKNEHIECIKIQDDPSRAPHRFVYLRNTPDDADPWNEENWYHANPALGDFFSIQTLREEALEAKNDPTKENAFRQFHLNQWLNTASRWMPMHMYNAAPGNLWLRPEHGFEEMRGRVAWAGFDLAARFDLTAWCLAFPNEDDDSVDLLWRFWLPEKALADIDKRNSGKATRWAREGWLTVTDGDVLDYRRVYADIGKDADNFIIAGADADQWSMFPVIQEIADRTSLDAEHDIVAYTNTYANMSPGLKELMALVKQEKFHHHGNPVAEWCFDNVEIRKAPYDPELIRPDKPDRMYTGKRIDAVPAASMAINAWKTRGNISRESAYESNELFVL